MSKDKYIQGISVTPNTYDRIRRTGKRFKRTIPAQASWELENPEIDHLSEDPKKVNTPKP